MKKSIIQFSAVAVFLFAGFTVYSNPAKNEANEVEITVVEDLHMGNSIEKIWKLSFSKQETPVTVAYRPVGNGTEYIIRSEYFEIIYANDREGFGVRKMRPSLKEVPNHINYSVLNEQQLQKQRILSPTKISDEVALEIISAFLPDLINEDYRHLIY